MARRAAVGLFVGPRGARIDILGADVHQQVGEERALRVGHQAVVQVR